MTGLERSGGRLQYIKRDGRSSPTFQTLMMERLAVQQQVVPQLPPGFRFHPTDEELLTHYLKKKVSSSPIPGSLIAEIDLYKHDPWDLPAKACFGEQEWYFFSPRDRKYPNGARPNRFAGSGYWKATGTDKPIVITSGSTSPEKVGVKKSLVFYKGRPLKGFKTNWIMHEYRLAETTPTKRNRSMRLDDWVLCRIYKKVSHSPMVVSCQDVDSQSPGDVKRSQPKFSSFSRLLQTEGPFMENLLSHATSDVNNVALSTAEPSSELKSHVSMSMDFDGDEVSSVYPAKRQNIQKPYLAGAVPDSEHMYRFPLTENRVWNSDLVCPLSTGNAWSSYENG